MWTDEDEERVLYLDEDALVIKVTVLARSLTKCW